MESVYLCLYSDVGYPCPSLPVSPVRAGDQATRAPNMGTSQYKHRDTDSIGSNIAIIGFA